MPITPSRVLILRRNLQLRKAIYPMLVTGLPLMAAGITSSFAAAGSQSVIMRSLPLSSTVNRFALVPIVLPNLGDTEGKNVMPLPNGKS